MSKDGIMGPHTSTWRLINGEPMPSSDGGDSQIGANPSGHGLVEDWPQPTASAELQRKFIYRAVQEAATADAHDRTREAILSRSRLPEYVRTLGEAASTEQSRAMTEAWAEEETGVTGEQ